MPSTLDRDDARKPKQHRGVYEHPKDSGVWCVCFFDENGRRHRQKVGPKALAIKVYQKRKTEVQERRFFPERLRRRDVLLTDFFKDYLARVHGRLRCYREYERSAKRLGGAFPGRTLRQILPGDIERYIAKPAVSVAARDRQSRPPVPQARVLRGHEGRALRGESCWEVQTLQGEQPARSLPHGGRGERPPRRHRRGRVD